VERFSRQHNRTALWYLGESLRMDNLINAQLKVRHNGKSHGNTVYHSDFKSWYSELANSSSVPLK
jgi:hypothetical protein